LLAQIQELFQFCPDWYRRSEVVRARVGQYYVVLRSVVRQKPQLRRCLSRCRHCGIFFLTHPRNAGRQDLGCPFGCQAAHRKQSSTARSVAYYRDAVGKEKKRMHNDRRRRDPERADPSRRVAVGPGEGERPHMLFQASPVLGYIGMVVSLIEGRRVSQDEIVEMLARAVRQHSIFRRRRMEYLLSYWKKRARYP
jgi:hypothetical protein